MSAFQIGQKVRIKDHIRWQHLSKGAVISPMIPHTVHGGQIVPIRAIYAELWEDEHGNDVYEEIIDTYFGEFSPDELEIVEQLGSE